MLLAAAADGAKRLEILVEPRHALAAVAVHDVDVAIGGHRHVGGIGPVKRLGSAALFDAAANLVENFAFEIGFINAGAEFGPLFVGADVLGPVNELLRALFAPIQAMRGIGDLRRIEADLVRKFIAPRLN